jgi:hypothetical protein
MQNRRAVLAVAALAAGSFGIFGCASTSSAAGSHRLAQSAAGGNAPRTYNYVRTDTGGPRADAPYALAGRGDRPSRYRAVGNAGGNGRVINLVPKAD